MMAKPDANEWLRVYARQHIDSMNYLPGKSAMRDTAAACMEAACTAGFSAEAIKIAAGGDLETYLLRLQNALTDAANESLMKDD